MKIHFSRKLKLSVSVGGFFWITNYVRKLHRCLGLKKSENRYNIWTLAILNNNVLLSELSVITHK